MQLVRHTIQAESDIPTESIDVPQHGVRLQPCTRRSTSAKGRLCVGWILRRTNAASWVRLPDTASAGYRHSTKRANETMTDQQKTVEPKFRTESIEDLRELLERAENWSEAMMSPGIAAEFADAREFVEELESETNE